MHIHRNCIQLQISRNMVVQKVIVIGVLLIGSGAIALYYYFCRRTGEPPQDQGPSDEDGGSGPADTRSSDAAGRPFEDIELTGPPGVPGSRWSAPAGLNQ